MSAASLTLIKGDNLADRDVFKLIHTMEMFTNQAIMKWNQSFQHDIGVSPVLVLSELQHQGPKKQSELADKLGFTPGAMTNIANRLIREGYARRKYNENDRRVIQLEITLEGQTVLRHAHEKGKQLHLELFQALSETEIEQFLSIYEKLLQQSERGT